MQRDDAAAAAAVAVAGANDEITVDVIAVDDQEQENVCDSKPEEITGWYDNTRYITYSMVWCYCKAIADENFAAITGKCVLNADM